MSRKRSNDSRHGPTPFTNTGDIVPPLEVTMGPWQSNNEEPWTSLNAGKGLKIRRTDSGKRAIPLQKVPEVSVYEPADYLNTSEDLTTHRSILLPSTHRNQRQRTNSRRLSLSSSQFPSSSSLSQSPATPTSDQLTNATSLPSDMSRQSSITSSICGGLDMMQIKSNNSDISSTFSIGEEHSPLVEPYGSLNSFNDSQISLYESDRSCFLPHTGYVVNDLQFPKSASCSLTDSVVPAPPVSFDVIEEDVSMKRSSSTESNASSRATRRRQEQVAQASRKIAPKLSDDEASMSRQSSASGHQMIRIQSADGSSKEVMPIEKAPYVRPSHDKIKCQQCDEHPEGFRGPHELQRHTERAHSVVRKAWVCVDISTDKKFLASCKACRNKKKYNAYYNAVAHLRRIHFNPKQKGRKGKAKPEEHRGGKGGGDFPAIDIVKEWMQEIDEIVPENMPDNMPQYDEDDFAIDNVGLSQPNNEFESPITQPSYADISNDEYLDSLVAHTHSSAASTVQPKPNPFFASSAPLPTHAFVDGRHQSQEQVPVTCNSNMFDLSFDVSMDHTYVPFDISPLDVLQPFVESNDSNASYFLNL